METTDKTGCKILVELLVQKGIKRVVLSPGSRNAPLIIAFAREPHIEHFVVLDERSAAFIALGMVQQSGNPVVLVCTSGTALLNYAPAVAEAFYQHLPLIVISADRPEEWIDQNDSQTIRQRDVFRNYVKASYSFPTEINCNDEHWYINRMINEAINLSQDGLPGPVHINIPLREPLYRVKNYENPELERTVNTLYAEQQIGVEMMTELVNTIANYKKVMVLASFGAPDMTLNKSLEEIAGCCNVIVLTETVANLSSHKFIQTIDRVLSVMTQDEKKSLAPELLITFGGSLISKMVKTWLRNYPPIEHWHISPSNHIVDTMQYLTRHIAVQPCGFWRQLSGCIKDGKSNYAELWQSLKLRATYSHSKYIDTIPWCDLKAFSQLFPAIPEGAALQLSNSTPVRYAQLFEYKQMKRVDCNRGTSGIDGATSTAVGASWVNEEMTIFITGDMGFLYDSNALWSHYVTPKLKIVVMCNDGGGIFRFIQGPSELPELEEFFETYRQVDVEGFARLHGFSCWSVFDEQALQNVLPAFFAEKESASILAIHTPRKVNDCILNGYFRRK